MCNTGNRPRGGRLTPCRRPARAGAAALSGRQQRVASRSRSGAVRTYAAKQLHFNTNGEALKRMQVRSCSRAPVLPAEMLQVGRF